MELYETEITTQDSDAILKFLYEQKRKVEYKTLLTKASELFATCEVDKENSLEYIEETLDACLTHLIDDLYIDTNNEDEPGFVEGIIQVFTGQIEHYWITPQGRRFYKKGGYKREEELEEQSEKEEIEERKLYIKDINTKLENAEEGKKVMQLNIEQMQGQIAEMKRNNYRFWINFFLVLLAIILSSWSLYLDLWKVHLNPF